MIPNISDHAQFLDMCSSQIPAIMANQSSLHPTNKQTTSVSSINTSLSKHPYPMFLSLHPLFLSLALALSIVAVNADYQLPTPSCAAYPGAVSGTAVDTTMSIHPRSISGQSPHFISGFSCYYEDSTAGTINWAFIGGAYSTIKATADLTGSVIAYIDHQRTLFAYQCNDVTVTVNTAVFPNTYLVTAQGATSY